jgi:hypothetical protein
MTRNSPVRYLLCLFGLLLPLALPARNVDLATVPERRTVQLTIYNSEDLTLVRESRVVTFKQGVNPLQFSWANTLIDPTSVELKFREPQTGLEVLDTTFPHDKPQTLYWNVHSDANREATIEISYFTSGITWAADYLAIADPEEQTLRLESFVRVRNHSGEDYENAQVRLVVGNRAQDAFGAAGSELFLVDAAGVTTLPHADKLVQARRLVAEIAERLACG